MTPNEAGPEVRRSRRRRATPVVTVLAALGAAVLLTVVVMNVGLRAVGLLEESCPRPARAGPGPTEPVTQGMLVSLLPGRLSGFEPGFPQSMKPPSEFTGRALSRTPFLYGFRQTHNAGGTAVNLQVLQFADPAGAERYEAEATELYCEGPSRTFPVDVVPGASGMAYLDGREETTWRVSFIRGSRDFVAFVRGVRLPARLAADVVVALAATADARQEQSPASLLGRIVYVSAEEAAPRRQVGDAVVPSARGSNLWVMDPDGGNRRPLTQTGFDADPDLSVDGTLIAWAVRDDEVWVMGSDGSNRRRVGDCELSCAYPSLSPDGRRLAYVDTDGTDGDVVVVGTDGSGERRYESPLDVFLARWSPDGGRLALSAGAGDSSSIWMMDITSGAEQEIRVGGAAPSWSPDGQTLVFTEDDSVVAMAPDGTDVRPLTAPSAREQWSAGGFSPDGGTIAVHRFDNQSGASEMWTMKADGSDARRIRQCSASCGDPTF